MDATGLHLAGNEAFWRVTLVAPTGPLDDGAAAQRRASHRRSDGVVHGPVLWESQVTSSRDGELTTVNLRRILAQGLRCGPIVNRAVRNGSHLQTLRSSWSAWTGLWLTKSR